MIKKPLSAENCLEISSEDSSELSLIIQSPSSKQTSRSINFYSEKLNSPNISMNTSMINLFFSEPNVDFCSPTVVRSPDSSSPNNSHLSSDSSPISSNKMSCNPNTDSPSQFTTNITNKEEVNRIDVLEGEKLRLKKLLELKDARINQLTNKGSKKDFRISQLQFELKTSFEENLKKDFQISQLQSELNNSFDEYAMLEQKFGQYAQVEYEENRRSKRARSHG